MDRYSCLLEKERKGTLTNEESDELFELREEEYNEGLSEAERVGMAQTQWGWM